MADTQALQSLSNFQGDHLSVHMDAGDGSRCIGDVVCVFDAAMTAASNTLTSATANFTSGDVGKLLKVYDAGPGQFSPHLYGKVKSVTNSTTIKVGDGAGVDLPAARTVSASQALYGTDYTLQFAALLSAGNSLYVPFGAYAVQGPLTVKPGVRVYGQCKGAGLFSPGGSGPGTANAAIGSCLVNFSDSEFVFQFLSTDPAAQVQDGFTFEHLTIISKNGVRLNDPTVAASSQSHIHPVSFKQVLFQGDYDYPNDPEAFTDTLPTATGFSNSLDQYGVGIAGRKLLRPIVDECTFYNYGISAWMCDWSQGGLFRSRVVHGGVFAYLSSPGNGFDCNRPQIINCEIIEFSRKGGIYNEYSNGLLIQGNYEEQNSAADLSWLSRGNPTYLWSDYDDNLRLCDVAFLDNYSLTAPTYRLSPRFPALVTGNTFLGSGLTHPFAEVDESHYVNTSFTVLAFIHSNGPNFPVPDHPGVVKTPAVNRYLMRYDNPDQIFGAVTSAFPWTTSATTGDWIIKTATAGFIWLPPVQSRAHRDFRVAITARFLGGSTFFVSIYLFYKVADIIGMSATAPIVVETGAAHGLSTADTVLIKDFLATDFTGFPGAGISQIIVTDATHFSLNGSDGTTGGSYRQGGEVYKRVLLGTYNPSITKTTRMETGYIQFGLPDAITTKCILGIDTNNDRAEIYSIELSPFEDVSTFLGRDGQTAPLRRWQTYDGVDRATLGIDGRLSLPAKLTSAAFKTANYTVLPTDEYIEASSISGSVTLTLPTLAATFDSVRGLGQRFLFKWLSTSSTNTLTLDGSGSEQIEGALTFVFNQPGDAIILQNDGTMWRIVSVYRQIGEVWRWVSIGTSIRTDYQVGINCDPGASIFLDVNGIVRGSHRDSSVTANRPARWDGSKQLINGVIDLGQANDLAGSGLASGQVVGWNGSILVSKPGLTTAVTLVTSVGGTTDTFFKSPSGTGSAFISISTTTVTMNFTDGLYTS